MAIKTLRLLIKRVQPRDVVQLTPLLEYQSLFRRGGLVTNGQIDLNTLQFLAQSDCLLQIEKKNHKLIGLIFLLHVYGDTGEVLLKHYELGYLLIPQAQHYGYMTEALSSVCRKLQQNHIGLVAEVRKDNKPSKRVLQRCGFTRTGSDSSELIERWQL